MEAYSDELKNISIIFSESFDNENKNEEKNIEDIKIDLGVF